MLPEPPAQTSRPAAATARNTGLATGCDCDFFSSLCLPLVSASDLATLSTVVEFPTTSGRVTTAISCQLFPPSSDRCKLPVELMVQREVDAGAALGAPELTTGGFALSTTSPLSVESRGSPTFRLWSDCSRDTDPPCAAI